MNLDCLRAGGYQHCLTFFFDSIKEVSTLDCAIIGSSMSNEFTAESSLPQISHSFELNHHIIMISIYAVNIQYS